MISQDVGIDFVFSEMLHLIRMGRTCLRLNEHRNCFYVATVESGGRDLLYLGKKQLMVRLLSDWYHHHHHDNHYDNHDNYHHPHAITCSE